MYIECTVTSRETSCDNSVIKIMAPVFSVKAGYSGGPYNQRDLEDGSLHNSEIVPVVKLRALFALSGKTAPWRT